MQLRSITINDTGDRQFINLAEVDGHRHAADRDRLSGSPGH